MFRNSLRGKGVGSPGRIRTSNISVNSHRRYFTKSCRSWALTEGNQQVLTKRGESTSPLLFIFYSQFAAFSHASRDIFVTAFKATHKSLDRFRTDLSATVSQILYSTRCCSESIGYVRMGRPTFGVNDPCSAVFVQLLCKQKCGGFSDRLWNRGKATKHRSSKRQ